MRDRVSRGVRLRRLVPVVALLAAAVAGGCSSSGPGLVPLDAPFIATPDPVGIAMLRLAETSASDVVYDLGSGDGRVVIAAAREFAARGVGVEIDPALVQQSRESALRVGVADRVRFLWQDIFATPVGEATVVTLYLGEALNLKLRPKLLAELRPGARVVSHAFGMAEWAPDRALDARGPAGTYRIMLWVVPASVQGRWQATAGGQPATLVLEQRFSEVDGRLVHGERSLTLKGRLEGAQLTLQGEGWILKAGVTGERATGTLTPPGAGPLPLEGERIRP
jgi:SAM-dependent methyltransferase